MKIWDARPWTEDSSAEREALGQLAFLFARPLPKADVIEYLRGSTTIRPRAQQMALALVDRYHEETDAESYHRASWAAVRQRLPEFLPVSLRPASGGARLPPGPRSGPGIEPPSVRPSTASADIRRPWRR